MPSMHVGTGSFLCKVQTFRGTHHLINLQEFMLPSAISAERKEVTAVEPQSGQRR